MKITWPGWEPAELPDEWWHDADMHGFVASGISYRSEDGPGRFVIPIDDIVPLRRNLGVPIFNACETMTARERVVRILRGFARGDLIPPIEVTDVGDKRIRLYDGFHRLYCSIAAGYQAVPVTAAWGQTIDVDLKEDTDR